MAEILALTASLIAVSNLGTKLTRTLYDFATTVSSAREEVDYIGANVSDYADILELLVEQLEHDRPIHSKRAIRLAERLYDRSHILFDRIRCLIPDKQRTRDHVSFLDRISWNFKKTRVHHLIGELECLKRTVQLLVQVLSTARQFQAYRNHVGESEERQKKKEKVHRHFLRTENVIVEWQRAEEKVASLREASELEDRLQIQAGSAPTDAKEILESEEERSLIKMPGNTLATIQATTTGVTRSEAEKRALVLQNTDNWVEQLLEEWTLLGIEREKDEPNDEAGSYETGPRYNSTPKAETGETDDTTGEPQTPLSPRASTRYATVSGEKLSLHASGRPSLPRPSVEQSDGEHDRQRRSENRTRHGATTKQHLREQPGDASPKFRTASIVTDRISSPEPQWTPLKRSNSDSSLSGDLVCFYEGSTNDKSDYVSPVDLALRRRSESKEHYQIDKLRNTLNLLCSGVRRPLSYDRYEALADQILREVILKADSLHITETDARVNRKELIDQAEYRLKILSP